MSLIFNVLGSDGFLFFFHIISLYSGDRLQKSFSKSCHPMYFIFNNSPAERNSNFFLREYDIWYSLCLQILQLSSLFYCNGQRSFLFYSRDINVAAIRRASLYVWNRRFITKRAHFKRGFAALSSSTCYNELANISLQFQQGSWIYV